MKNKFYITTAIDYANNVPHLGTAYEKVCADIIARYMRLKGFDTFFSMGNDEHSQNVYKGAMGKGLSPQEFTDQMAQIFQDTWKAIGISYDRFIRTTEGKHVKAVHEIFHRINARGDIYKAKYSGWYCVSCEGFLREDDLVEGRCPAHKMEPKWIEEENLFFALSKYADRVLRHIEENPDFIQPETRKNEIVSFIKGGVSDVSISRAGAEWGIPVPTQPAQVFYVWFDALINYLTSVGFPDDMELFARYWPADLHVIGKDITRFHCILWPAMLMSADIDLPRSIHGHGFITFKGERMSKTLGNIVDPLDLARKYGPDSLRYYLAREIVFGKDGDFSWDQFIQRYNSELANDLGNLVNRTCGMIKQYLGSRIPAEGERAGDGFDRMRSECERSQAAYFKAMDAYEIHNGIGEAFKIIRSANRFIEENAPWALMKQPDGKPKTAAVLFTVCETLRQVAVLLSPFMPSKAQEIWRALGIRRDITQSVFDETLRWRKDWSEISTEIGPIKPLFPRIEIETRREAAVSSQDPKQITFDEFKRMDLRVAKVKSATLVPGAKKLLRLEIDLGGEERQIVAGIAEHYAPEDLVGKRIVVVANLKPARIRGIESQGMLLAATDGDKVILIVPDKDASPGAKIS